MVKLESLKKSNQFRKALKEKKFHTEYYSIFAAKNFFKPNHKNNLLISFVMKKKIGNAVKRNKVKRRLRNIINEAIKRMPLNFKYSYLVIAKPTMLNNDYTNMKETLFQELKKIR